MTDDTQDLPKDTVSALRVQRDSAHRTLARLDAENRWLRKHQADIRTWLTDSIQQWGTARTTDRAVAVGDEIAKMATELLRETANMQRPQR